MTKKRAQTTARENECRGRYAGCTADPPAGKRMCDNCRAEHNRRAADRRAALKAARRCTVCGARAAVVGGEPLNTCAEHREYFRAAAEAARGGS